MSELTTELNAIQGQMLSTIARNLGAEEILEGSYIHTTVTALAAATEAYVKQVKDELKDLSLLTASETALDIFGASLGFPRARGRVLLFKPELKDAVIKLKLKRPIASETEVYHKGYTVESLGIKLTFLSPFKYDSNKAGDNYIHATLELDSDRYRTNATLKQNQVTALPVPSHLKDDLEAIYLEVKNEHSFLAFNETVEEYRSRLARIISTKNVFGDTTLYHAIQDISPIYQHYINSDAPITEVYISTKGLYSTDDEQFKQALNDTENYVVPMAYSRLKAAAPFGKDLVVKLPKVLNYQIEITGTSEKITREMLNTAISILQESHVLGVQGLIHNADLVSILKSFDSEANYEARFFYTYEGFRVETEDAGVLRYEATELPRAVSITYRRGSV